MNNQFILLIVTALLVGAIGGYLFGSMRPLTMYTSTEMHTDNSMLDMHHMSSDGPMMHQGEMMEHMDMMMVTSEQAFIEGMIPHHQEAIDTAREVLERGGTTPEIRTLAENIIVAQEAEIADMKQWYEDWYSTLYEDTGEYTPMMRDLSRLSGAELDRTFLSDMIMHHMGAIMMAQSVQPYIEHPEMEDLTRAVIETQSVEIQQMRSFLENL